MFCVENHLLNQWFSNFPPFKPVKNLAPHLRLPNVFPKNYKNCKIFLIENYAVKNTCNSFNL